MINKNKGKSEFSDQIYIDTFYSNVSTGNSVSESIKENASN